MYWSGINADIANYVCWCTICTKHKASPPAQPMLPRDIPNAPWQEIAADYLTHKCKEYLLICNPISKYPFLYKVMSILPTPCPSTCMNSYPSMDYPVLSTQIMAPLLYLTSSPNSCSTITLTMLPHPPTSPSLMALLNDK